MISFNLICPQDHGFEGWFSSSADFDDQQNNGLLSCPLCGDGRINKALMAPNVAAKSNSKKQSPVTSRTVMSPAANAPPSADVMKMLTAMRQIQNKIEKECDNVGDKFAEEARKIHYGESDARGIYGNASDEAAMELYEEGIEINKIPWLPKEH